MHASSNAAVKDFVQASLKHRRVPELTVIAARIQGGEDFANAVAVALANGIGVIRPSARSIHAQVLRYRKEKLEEAGIEPIRIPHKEPRMREAIRALVHHVDEGKKPSALAAAAAGQPGLDQRQVKKLAYSVPVKRSVVESAVDLEPDSPFVQKLLRDAGMTDLVIDGHVSLSKLAAVLSKTHRSLAQRVQQLEAAVIVLAGEQQHQRELIAAQGMPGNSRGAWHARALALRSEGKTGNQIARLLGQTPNAVEKVLARKSANLPQQVQQAA